MTDDKKITGEGDLVLVHYQDKPAVYARIEAVEPDIKKDWYQVTLTLLTVPHQVITWILRAEYINGESFTMNGNAMKLVLLERLPVENNNKNGSSEGADKIHKSAKKSKVIAFKKGSDQK